MSDNRPINPLRLAEKMHKVRNFENEALFDELVQNPRFVEVLWALQFFSRPARQWPGHEGKCIDGYTGGLRVFAADLIKDSMDLIGTQKMREFGLSHYSLTMARSVYHDIGGSAEGLSELGEPWLLDAVFGERFPDLTNFFEERRPSRTPRPKIVSALAKRATREAFTKLCLNAARNGLAGYLRNLCELPNVRFSRTPKTEDWCRSGDEAPWYFVEIGPALVRFIDRRRERLESEIAETEVTREIGKWLGRARATGRGVPISGNSRFGKTEAVQTSCEANPGLARLVETPASNSLSDLLRAVAKALGMELGPMQRGYQLREEIAYLVEQAGLMLVFDEAQAIFPSSFGRNTAPARLNWIRRSVLDRGVSAAFVFTPQAYNTARKKFLRTTDFAIEQWDERLFPIVHLPNEVSQEDLLAIARVKFPSLDPDYLEYVVNAVAISERNFVSDISRIADLARLNAQESGRSEPTLADLKAAIADALPVTKPAIAIERRQSQERPGAIAARPTVPNESIEFPHRIMKPEVVTDA